MATAPEALLAQLREKQAALQSISVKNDVEAVIDANIKELDALQRDQLFQGKDKDGRPLMSILDDPYFKSKAAAYKYAYFKQDINKRYGFQTPFAQPNLFINGYTHSTLHVIRSGSNVEFSISAPWADEVAAKYHNKELGLNDDSKGWFIKRTLRPTLLQKYSNLLGCKIRKG